MSPLARYLVRFFSKAHGILYRMSDGRFFGKLGQASVLLLTVTGCKSGKPRTTPLLYIEDGDGFAVVASFGGAAKHPGWYRNLEKNPKATVQIEERVIPVTASTAYPEEIHSRMSMKRPSGTWGKQTPEHMTGANGQNCKLFPVSKIVPGFLFALMALLQAAGAGQVKNPAPGDPYPEDFVYDISGGGQFRLADFKGKKAVLITNHIVDDGSVSWHADPFKRLKELQAMYKDRLAVAVMPEHAHHRTQTRALWEAAAADVRELLNPGNLPILIESRGAGGPMVGRADHSLYQALNPEKLYSWWPMVLIDKEGNIAWTSKNPQTGNAEHMIYETELRPAVVKLLEPEGYRKWLSEVPQDWVRQDSPWGRLEIEDFERYRDMGDLHVSSTWTSNPSESAGLPATFKGELSLFPTRTGHRALAPHHFSQQAAFAFGYPYYYGFRDPGYGLWVHHAFEGSPRTGTLVFFFATFLRAAKLNAAEDRGRAFSCLIEGADNQSLRLVFGRLGRFPAAGADNVITGDIQTNATWNPEAAWNRLSFHVDRKAGTKIFLGRKFLGEAPQIKEIAGIQFEAGWACSVDDLVMIPRDLSLEELDEVVRWVDEQARQRPHVTPLERESEIKSLGREKKTYPRVLRVNWGSADAHTDAQGRHWLAGQRWLRGSFGALDGDDFTYPADVPIQGSQEQIYRTVRYSAGRLRFTVPRGYYTLRMHFARPFHWATGASMEHSVELEIEPDGPERDLWGAYAPYRTAVVREKNGIRVVDGILDVRFNYRSPVHVAATELIQESVDAGEAEGIPAWPSEIRH